MILSSVIIVLGEVLELTVLASLFLALSFRFRFARYWLVFALSAGSLLAILYAVTFDNISQWQDGFGQEIINAGIQFGIYFCLLLFNTLIYIAYHHRLAVKYLQWVMALAISLAVTREGSEIYLYLSGFMLSPELIAPVITGSVVGAGIGLSLGVLIYYLLVYQSPRKSLYIGYTLLLFVAAGTVLQAVRLLIQIDWLPAQAIVWDVSNWIEESSAIGRLLFILVGYEATPTPIEIQFYVAAVFAILLVTAISHYFISKKTSGN